MNKKPIQMEKLETCDFKLKLKLVIEQVWFQLFNFTCKCYKLKGDALLIAKVIITFQLVSLLIDKVDYHLSPGISSYWQRWLLQFTLYHLLLAKVTITFYLISPLIGKGNYYLSSCIFHLIGKGDHYLSSCISLIGKGNHYLLPCIFHLMGKGEYYLSTCILNLIGKGDYYHSPRSTY